ncbi:MAG TPA: OsmC family protein [Desulfosarcina sp.]|nr:OsmC family protein [Desulfosarcina sp.]
MDVDELRALQAPIKQGYKEHPASAMVAARAEASVDAEGIACRVATFAGEAAVGLHPAAGGDGSEACSADMLLEALAGCAGVTLKAVATAMRIPLGRSKVIAEGYWDARGTLAVDRETPVGVTKVKLTFELDTSADQKKLDKLIELTERYCVVYQTLANPPALETGCKLISGS